jgi:FkbM family methyltransferase
VGVALRRWAHLITDVTFVQIGSNDGITNDPLNYFIRRYQWSGLLVEPVPSLFEKLRRNYRHSRNLQFANVAIGTHDGDAAFYYVADTRRDDPFWTDEIGSFNLQHVLNHAGAISDLTDRVRTMSVRVLTLPQLFDQYNISRVDLLHVDAEGHDDQIIAQIDWTSPRAPTALLYEHRHMTPEQQKAIEGPLLSRGAMHATGFDDRFLWLERWPLLKEK